jgi:hypothetical protein
MRIASKRRFQDEDIAQELILDSDAHTSEVDISAPQSDGDNKKDDKTETGWTEWIDSTQSRLSVPILHRFTGGPSGLRQNEAPNINKDTFPLRVFS